MKNFSESSCVGSIKLDKPATDEEIINRWTRFGLIDKSYDDELKLGICKSYEDMAYALVSGKTYDDNNNVIVTINDWFEKDIFPVINRVVRCYYYKHNEIKTIKPEDYIQFFMSTSIGDIIENTYPIYDKKSFTGEPLSEDALKKEIENRKITKECFNKVFEIRNNKDTKLIEFDYNTVYDDIKAMTELDVEAVFVCMICDVLFAELFEK